MTELATSLDELLADLGIVVVPTLQRRRPGQTHAGGVMRQIIRKHGFDVIAVTLRTIRGSERNRDCLSSETIGAVADVLAQMPAWCARPAELAHSFDGIDLEAMRARSVRLRPWPVRETLRVAVFAALASRVDAAEPAETQIQERAA